MKKFLIPTLIVVAILLAVLIITVIIPFSKYLIGSSMLKNGKVIKGYDMLSSLGDYLDSEDKLKYAFDDYYVAKLETANVGDTLFLGEYEQDNISSNGKEPIEWIVLDKRGYNVLVVSKYALDSQQYDSDFDQRSWETSSLRDWLGNTFMNDAFSSTEEELIAPATLATTYINDWKLNENIEITEDKIFLLSAEESEQYFTSDEDRRCEATPYLVSKGARQIVTKKKGFLFFRNEKSYTSWWLRNKAQGGCVNVFSDGYIFTSGDDSTLVIAVRPAMWLNLSDYQFTTP